VVCAPEVSPFVLGQGVKWDEGRLIQWYRRIPAAQPPVRASLKVFNGSARTSREQKLDRPPEHNLPSAATLPMSPTLTALYYGSAYSPCSNPIQRRPFGLLSYMLRFSLCTTVTTLTFLNGLVTTPPIQLPPLATAERRTCVRACVIGGDGPDLRRRTQAIAASAILLRSTVDACYDSCR
jgi:hypothetical protein